MHTRTTEEANDTGTHTGNDQPFGDPRPSFAKAGAIAGSIIDQVRPEHLRNPTPCSEFDVENLTRHVIAVGHRTLAMGRGEPAESVPIDAPELAFEDLAGDWHESMRIQAAQWEDDRLLGQPMVLPWTTLPGAIMLSIYTAEILIHTWDLATALGLQPEWDQELAAEALQTIQLGIPAEARGDDVPFDPVTPTAADAPAMDRLVAWLGRHP